MKIDDDPTSKIYGVCSRFFEENRIKRKEKKIFLIFLKVSFEFLRNDALIDGSTVISRCYFSINRHPSLNEESEISETSERSEN